MKNVIIAGASGMVGKELLMQLLTDPATGMVYNVTRKPPDAIHENMQVVLTDFGNLDFIAAPPATDAYCCLGTTLKAAGSKSAQYRIDHDFVLSFAKWCLQSGVQNFAVVSSLGAKASSGNFYLRTKGQMENDLIRLPFAKLIVVRPSLLMGKRTQIRPAEKAAMRLMPWVAPLLIGNLKKYRGVPAASVARCMHQAVNDENPGVRIIESDKINEL